MRYTVALGDYQIIVASISTASLQYHYIIISMLNQWLIVRLLPPLCGKDLHGERVELHTAHLMIRPQDREPLFNPPATEPLRFLRCRIFNQVFGR